MASKALISSASAMAPNRPKSGPISVGLGPRFVFFSSSSSASKRASSRRSLVVRSQDNNAGKEPNTPPSQATTTNADYGRWKSIEDKNYELKYEMPGKMASEKVDMKVEENMLVIKDTIELPPYCSKRDIKANLNDGSLIVTVPKIPKYEPTTIPIPVFSVPINKKPADDDPSSSDNNKPADDPSSSVNNKPADDSSTNKPADQIFKDQAGALAGSSKVKFHVPTHHQVQNLPISHHYVQAPWSDIEEEDQTKVSLDMPWLPPEDIEVDIINDLPHTPCNVHQARWSHIEEEDQVKVSLDMTGLRPEDIEVDIVNNLLIIAGSERNAIDELGRKILSYYVKLQLPMNCVKDRVNAVFKNGFLYVTVPKIPINNNIRPINVQVVGAS